MSPSFETAFSAFLKSDIARRTQATPRLLALDRPGFVSESELFSPDEWKTEPHFDEWSSKWGFHHAAATAIHVPSGELLVFHLERNAGRPAFSQRDLALLDSFRPHLARASFLSARWRLERLRAAAEALALIGLPALILDSAGRILAANDLIQRSPVTDYLLWRSRNRVALKDPAADALLQRGLATLMEDKSTLARSFPVRSGLNQTPVVAHLIPTPGQARNLFDGAIAVLVVTPVATPVTPNLAVIRGLFDLTPKEVQVIRGIAKGMSLREIATNDGVSHETIRTQFKSVLAKTGTHRQSEVASLLGGIPDFPIVKK